MVVLTNVALCVAFALVSVLAYKWGYKVFGRSQQMLTLYALATGALRLLTAAIFVLAYLLLVSDGAARRSFVITFLVTYLFILTFDATYFIRSQKSNSDKKNLNK